MNGITLYGEDSTTICGENSTTIHGGESMILSGYELDEKIIDIYMTPEDIYIYIFQ